MVGYLHRLHVEALTYMEAIRLVSPHSRGAAKALEDRLGSVLEKIERYHGNYRRRLDKAGF